MSARRKVLFIINKVAGTGYNGDVEKEITRFCDGHNIDCIIEFTSGRGHAIELARNAVRNSFQLVVAVGGDGTVNEVAQGLIDTGVPLGIIPNGSGNGLARHLGIPLNFIGSIDQLFKSTMLSMDTFTVNKRLSLNVSGIGFDGHVTNLFGVGRKRGLLGYVNLVIREFFKFKEFNAHMVLAEKILSRTAFVVAIANSSQYGNNARIAPMASVFDGLLHLNIVKKVPFYRLDFLLSFFSGSVQQSRFCEIIETSAVKFKTRIPVAYHVDGEPCGLNDKFEIELHPGSLNVMVPEHVGKKDCR